MSAKQRREARLNAIKSRKLAEKNAPDTQVESNNVQEVDAPQKPVELSKKRNARYRKDNNNVDKQYKNKSDKSVGPQFTNSQIYEYENIIIERSKIRHLIDLLNTAASQDGSYKYVDEIKEKYGSKSMTPVMKAIYSIYIGKAKYNNIIIAMHKNFSEFGFYQPNSEKCFNHWDMHSIFRQEAITYKAKPKAIKICDIKTIDIGEKIPHIIHNVWLTSETRDTNTTIAAFKKNNLYFEINSNFTNDWSHIMWLSSPEASPKEILSEIQKYNFEVKYINELAKDPKSTYLINVANTVSELGYYSMASDIIRALSLKEYGGVYMDGDYKLVNNLDHLSKSFDFVAGYATKEKKHIEACFLASLKGHHLFEKHADMIVRNFDGIQAPNYIKYPCGDNHKSMNMAGPVALTMSFAKDIQINKNQDVILPPGITARAGIAPYDFKDCIDSDFSKNIGIIGNDNFSNSWVDLSPLSYNCSLT